MQIPCLFPAYGDKRFRNGAKVLPRTFVPFTIVKAHFIIHSIMRKKANLLKNWGYKVPGLKLKAMMA